MRIAALAVLASALIASSSVAQTPLFSHRLVFAPTATPIPAGQWTVGLTEFVLPNTALGVGDVLSVSAGTFFGPNEGGVMVEPKLTLLNRGRTTVAVGATGSASPSGNDGNWPRGPATVVPFVVATIQASEVTRLTLGAGTRINQTSSIAAGFSRDNITVVRAPVLFAGTEVRLSQTVWWVTEWGRLPDDPPRTIQPALNPGAILRESSLSTVARIQGDRFGMEGGVIALWAETSPNQRDLLRDMSLTPWISGTLALAK